MGLLLEILSLPTSSLLHVRLCAGSVLINYRTMGGHFTDDGPGIIVCHGYENC